jgi:LuxR family maltose regulon positive regulatory protein
LREASNVKDFLSTTALLDRFNEDLWRELRPQDPLDILNRVYRSNFFLSQMDDDPTWYRYNTLYRGVIRKWAKSSSPEAFRQTYRKAALWFIRKGLFEDGFYHAFASEDFEFAADLLEDYLLFLGEQCDSATCVQWLSRFPRDVLTGRPLLRFIECILKLDPLELVDIEVIIEDIGRHQDQAFLRYGEAKNRLCKDLLAYFQDILPYLRNAGSSDINRHVGEVLQKLSSNNSVLRMFVKEIITEGRFLDDGWALWQCSLKGVPILMLLSGSVVGRIIWARSAAYAERRRLNLSRAEGVLHDAFLFLESKNLSDAPVSKLLYPPFAWVCYFRGRLDDAFEYASIGLRHMEWTKSAFGVQEGNLLLALIHIARRELKEARDHVNKMLVVTRSTAPVETIPVFEAFAAWASLFTGDTDIAKEWRRPARRLSLDEPFSYLRTVECMTEAVFLYREGAYRQCADMLKTPPEQYPNLIIGEHIIDICLLRAAALEALGDHRGSEAMLENAIALSQRGGYVQQFATYSAMIAPVFKRMASGRNDLELFSYVRTFLNAASTHDSGVNPTAESKDLRIDLTPREIDVLNLIAAGCRNNEIAEKMFVSLSTVKTHIAHIFDKLSVKTRLQAIQYAKKTDNHD